MPGTAHYWPSSGPLSLSAIAGPELFLCVHRTRSSLRLPLPSVGALVAAASRVMLVAAQTRQRSRKARAQVGTPSPKVREHLEAPKPAAWQLKALST